MKKPLLRPKSALLPAWRDSFVTITVPLTPEGNDGAMSPCPFLRQASPVALAKDLIRCFGRSPTENEISVSRSSFELLTSFPFRNNRKSLLRGIAVLKTHRSRFGVSALTLGFRSSSTVNVQ